jgi:hypothetical protein
MVLLSTFILRRTLSSTEALQQFYAEFNNSEEKGKNVVGGEQVNSDDDELIIETEPAGKIFVLFINYLTRLI